MSSRSSSPNLFAWDSPYGYVVELVKQLRIAPGLVVDLGCGWGQVAEPLSDLGFKYVGIDKDQRPLKDLKRRGFDGFEVDLMSSEHLVDLLADKFAGRRVALVLMLDVVEHIPDTRSFLASLESAILSLERPPLIVSVPNVGHVDIGAKLALGRFDYTPTGLLDENHVSLFTERRLTREFCGRGWVEIGSNDFVLDESDQHFPRDHPALACGAPLARFISHVREQADHSARVNQFIRAYLFHEVERGEPQELGPAPFLSVLMRTTGTRTQTLTEALTCLAGQTVDDFEVKLMVHTSKGLDSQVADLVGRFHPTFSSRVEVIAVRDGGRARPLNVGLARSMGRYVAFLDDDDLVTGDWVEQFRQGAETASGQVIRSITLDQRVQKAELPGLSYLVQSGLQHSFQPEFDLAVHLYRNQSPICSFAVPRAAIEALALRFDESLPVTEDWEFLLRAAQVAGVHDTGRVTSIYRRWVCDEGSQTLVDKSVWEGVRRTILHRFDQAPLLLPSGSAGRLANYVESAMQAADLRAEVMDQRKEIDLLGQKLVHSENGRLAAHKAFEDARDAGVAVGRELAQAVERLRAIETSRSWRLTLRARQVLHYARRVRELARKFLRAG